MIKNTLNQRRCGVDGCGRGGRIKTGLCGMHYRRKRVHDDVNMVKRPDHWLALHEKEKIKNKLFSKCNKNENGCWIWCGLKDLRGYGYMKIGGGDYRVHRISAHVSWNFDLNSKMNICHKCDNPPCIRPDHLFEGTQKDNVRDMYSKGRAVNSCGEKVNTAKLNEHQVRRIRLMGEVEPSFARIGRMFHVSDVNIASIIRRTSWKHI